MANIIITSAIPYSKVGATAPIMEERTLPSLTRTRSTVITNSLRSGTLHLYNVKLFYLLHKSPCESATCPSATRATARGTTARGVLATTARGSATRATARHTVTVHELLNTSQHVTQFVQRTTTAHNTL